ncbi:MAG: hypothetical protein ACYCYK_05430 [Candidatus Dormibacteria bacterium]
MESRVELMAEQIMAGVLPHLGRTWRWRVGRAAAVAGPVVLAGSVAGPLASLR